MKLCIFTDNHWTQSSSIIRKRGEKYSQRLENQIRSLNWAVKTAKENCCDRILCLGDFFDKAVLNSEEMTALNELDLFNSVFYVDFLVGNHETGSNDMTCSSAHVLSLYDKTNIIDTPKSEIIGNTELCYLPYTTNDKRKTIKEIFGGKRADKRIIFSHNDIAGIRYGAFLSVLGYEINDIEENCDLFLNGHLHNGEFVTDKIINLGNLTGQNFSENAFKYSHCLMILDTDTLQLEWYENPFAFNFYKIENVSEIDIDLKQIKNNAVLTVKTPAHKLSEIKQLLEDCDQVIEYKIVLDNEVRDVEANRQEDLSIDHLEKFKEFVFDTIGTSDMIKEELEEVCDK